MAFKFHPAFTHDFLGYHNIGRTGSGYDGWMWGISDKEPGWMDRLQESASCTLFGFGDKQ
jgi:hypothetical protein